MFNPRQISEIINDYVRKFPEKDREKLNLNIDDHSLFLSLEGDIHSLRVINVIINVLFKNVDIQNSDQFLVFDLCLAIEETMINIFKHSYSDCSGKVELRVEFQNGNIIIEIGDYGEKGASFDYDDQMKKISVNEFSESGRGMLIIKKTIDEMKYSSLDGKNTLLLIKKWKG
ncbi:MAG: hypothetical protein A2Y33_03095 [Spirochaetes bacterium GWF1_51_8]|nr:MAG: hypothetical protein A2Y33_03095 [Spirochaetes bacterium GWF1_51_8]